MKRKGVASPRIIALVGVGVIVAGGAVWGLVGGSPDGEKNPLNLPENLLVDSLKKQADESPETMMNTMREVRRNEDLTDEQRDAARRNMGAVWRERMEKGVNEYFAAGDEEKNDVLDRHIDRMREMRERMQAERETRRRERESERKANGEQEEDRDARRRDMMRRRVGATRDERKSRSEARSPDQGARRMAYFSALRKRAQERGIDMGGRGGRGGRGGGHP